MFDIREIPVTMVITFEELADIRRRHPGKTIVYGAGVFDLLHSGHIEGLNFRRSLGDILVCGVDSDERTIERKRPPVHSEKDRLYVIDTLKPVDYTFLIPPLEGSNTMSMLVVHNLKPDIYVEYKDNEWRWSQTDRDYIKSLGTTLIFDTQPKRDSTSDIIARIKERKEP